MSPLAEASFSRWTRLQGVSQRVIRVGIYGFTAGEIKVPIVSVELVLSVMLLIFILNLNDDWMGASVKKARWDSGIHRGRAILLGPASSGVMSLMKVLLVASLVTHGRIHSVGSCGARVG